MSSIKSYLYKILPVIITAVFMLLATFAGAGAEEPRFIKKSFPGGFNIKEPVKFYDPQALYEYINGQAVFYLSYGFKRLEHGFYEKGDAMYYVDIYELDSGLSAFGALRQQREASSDDLGIGAEGATTDYLTVFFKGNFYVEIIPMSSVPDDRELMKLLAGHVEKLIPGSVELPHEVDLFPKEGLVPGSERYVDENLISYSFMGRGMVARYLPKNEKKEIRLFIALTDTDEKAQTIFNEYREKLQNPFTVKIGDIQGIKGIEAYRGTTVVSFWKDYVFGCLNVENESNAIDLLNTLLLNLKKSHD